MGGWGGGGVWWSGADLEQSLAGQAINGLISGQRIDKQEKTPMLPDNLERHSLIVMFLDCAEKPEYPENVPNINGLPKNKTRD